MINWILTKTPLLFLTQSLWRDEAFSYLMAKQSLFDIFGMTARDFNPPLYYVALHIYMWIFGHSEIMLRVFSLIFFNITIFAVCRIIEHVFGYKSAKRWIYLLLFALNPFMLYYGLEARMYAMTACFATLSWYFLMVKRPRKYLLATVLGLYTHYFFLLIVGAQFVYMMVSRTHTEAQKKKYIHIVTIAGIVFSFWILFMLGQSPPVGRPFWIIPPSLYTMVNVPAILLTGYENIFNFPKFTLFPFTILFLFTVIFGIKSADHTKRDRDILLLLACWAFIPAVVTLVLTPFKPLFLPRYLLISTPGIMLLTIFLIMKMRTREMKVAFLALYFIAFTAYNTMQIEFRKKADFPTVMKEINTLAGKNDYVYVDNELNFHPAQYYFDPKRVYIIGKTYEEIPEYVGKVLIPEDRIVSMPPRYPIKAFIIHDDLSYDIQSIY